MTQLDDLFEILKKQLRAQGFTYKLLAEKLNLSEASVKRMFTQEDINLSRLEAICSCLSMSLSELFVLLEKGKNVFYIYRKVRKKS